MISEESDLPPGNPELVTAFHDSSRWEFLKSNLPHLENSHLENLTLGFRNSEVRLRQSILPHTHTLSVPYHFPQIQRELQRLQQKKDLLRDRGLPWQWVLVGCFKEVVVEDTTWAKKRSQGKTQKQTTDPHSIGHRDLQSTPCWAPLGQEGS